VQTDEERGLIVIEQATYDINDERSSILVSPDQVPLLVEWLQEAKAAVEALNEKKHPNKP
jgi:hypothetical protein